MATHRKFHQIDSPRLGNQYLEDSGLQSCLEYFVPRETLDKMRGGLEEWGQRCVDDLQEMGDDAEAHPATVTHYNAWGKRIDKINTAWGYRRMKEIYAESGILAVAYERPYGEFSRLLQYSMSYLTSGAQGISYSCPGAMTDGGARLLELYLKSKDQMCASGSGKVCNCSQQSADKVVQLARTYFEGFTSRDPKKYKDCGQWMTEKTGGSDVSGTETIAIPQADGSYALSGYKFFTSATTSDVTFTLARIIDPEDPQGIKKNRQKLSLFMLELRDENGEMNNIFIHKLKNKFGTKSLPTAELELINSKAHLLGEPEQGVKMISTILNITRIGSCISALGMARRAVAVARDYSHRRTVFGFKLSKQPLHLHTLAALELEVRGCLYLIGNILHWTGLIETEKQAQSPFIEAHRLLIPLGKLYICKMSVAVISEAMECLGGTGYMEDSRLPHLYRDARVNSIWEGTTNVISMDVVRVLTTSPKSFDALVKYCTQMLEEVSKQSSKQDALTAKRLNYAIENCKHSLSKMHEFCYKIVRTKESAETALPSWLSVVRLFSFSMARTLITCLLLHRAFTKPSTNMKRQEAAIALRWGCRPLFIVGHEMNLAQDVLHTGDLKGEKFGLSNTEYFKLVSEEDELIGLDKDDRGVARGTGEKLNGQIRPRL
jgi:putative acyl-CoA dehydrogenase